MDGLYFWHSSISLIINQSKKSVIMEMKELIIGFLTKTLNLSDGEVAGLLFNKTADGQEVLKEGALDELLKRWEEQPDEKTRKELADQGYKRAQREIMSEFEKQLKQQYGIDSTAKGMELVAEIVAQAREGALSEEAVKAHPAYMALQASLDEEKDKLSGEYREKLSSLEATYSKKEMQKLIRAKAMELLNELKPSLPTDTGVADRRMQEFLYKMESLSLVEAEDGSYIVKDAEGKTLTDERGAPKTLAQVVAETASLYWNLEQQPRKGNAANNNTATGKNTALTIPRSEEEFNRAIFNAATPEQRMQILDAYNAATK